MWGMTKASGAIEGNSPFLLALLRDPPAPPLAGADLFLGAIATWHGLLGDWWEMRLVGKCND